MRYTESKLTRYRRGAAVASSARARSTGSPNFDGTLEEPTLLPARLPQPAAERHHRHRGRHGHRHPAAQPARGRQRLHAPARRAGGHDVRRLVRARARPGLPDRRRDHHAARGAAWRSTRPATAPSARAPRSSARTARSSSPRCPTRCRGSKVLEQIAAQMRAKKLPMVEDLRDESDHENPTRLVIMPRSNRVDVDAADGAPVRDHRPRDARYRVNLNVIGLDGRPQVMDLQGAARANGSRSASTRSRAACSTGWRRSNARLHLLEGLLIAYLNLDEVIRIIRTEDEPKRGADRALRSCQRGAGRVHPRDQAAPPGAARGNEDPRRAGRAREGARPAREACSAARRKLKKLVRDEIAGRRAEVRRRPPLAAGRARRGAGDRPRPSWWRASR